MTSLTLVNSLRQIADFVDYVDSFYGTSDGAETLYPLYLKGKRLTKEHIRHATIVYLDRCNNDDFEYCTWGDGDSLDRERVRDILSSKFGYGESKFYRSGTVR